MNVIKRIGAVSLLLSILLLSGCVDKTPQGYWGKDYSQSISVEYNAEKEVLISMVKEIIDENWSVFYTDATTPINMDQPLFNQQDYCEGDCSICTLCSQYTIKLDSSPESYFQLYFNMPDGGHFFAPRHLPMDGGFNYRDLGGRRTLDGKFVKWGLLFRADGLSELTEVDLSYLSSIPLVSVIDLRSDEEVSSAPDKLPSSVKNHFMTPIVPGRLMNILSQYEGVADEEYMASLMIDLNKRLVTDSLAINSYIEFFKIASDKKNLPLLYHCTAGKDRTGMASALLLSALNVDRELILEDYLMSNIYLEPKYRENIEKAPQYKPLFEVRREYIESALELIDQRYGSVEKYMVDVLKVDIKKLRDLYLY